MDIAGNIIAAIVGGVIVAAISWYANRKKTDAEAAKLISEAWEKLIEPYKTRIELLECGIKARDKDLMLLRAQMKELEIENQDLLKRLRELENGQK